MLAADSNIENAFDEGTVATLAEYTRLISVLIRSYTEKFDLQLSARTLDAFEQMHRAFTGTSLTPEAVAKMLVEHVSQLFDSTYVSCVLFDTERGEWRIAATQSDTLKWEVKALQTDMHGSLIGRATRFAEEIYIAQVGKEVRFRMGEKLPTGGTFLTLPLVAGVATRSEQWRQWWGVFRVLSSEAPLRLPELITAAAHGKSLTCGCGSPSNHI